MTDDALDLDFPLVFDPAAGIMHSLGYRPWVGARIRIPRAGPSRASRGPTPRWRRRPIVVYAATRAVSVRRRSRNGGRAGDGGGLLEGVSPGTDGFMEARVVPGGYARLVGNGMNLVRVDSKYQPIVVGLILIVFVGVEGALIYSLIKFRKSQGAKPDTTLIHSTKVEIIWTVIPIMIAAFAAYALAWMRFPGRALIIAAIIGLLVVPLQMTLIPLLELYNGVGELFGVPSKTYLGIWLAHTIFEGNLEILLP